MYISKKRKKKGGDEYEVSLHNSIINSDNLTFHVNGNPCSHCTPHRDI